jgi:hypothetical protein
MRGNEPRDSRYRRPRRRRHDDQSAADPDRLVFPPPHDLLQPAALFVRQPPRPDRLSHPPNPTLNSQHDHCREWRRFEQSQRTPSGVSPTR